MLIFIQKMNATPIGPLVPVGYIRSSLKNLGEAPNQGNEGAPDATLEINEAYQDALHRLAVGDEIILITWLHQADRSVLQVHPQGNKKNPLTGVFATRSPHRPNPLGLHRVTILERLSPLQWKVGPLEAIDGTPVVDVKIHWGE